MSMGPGVRNLSLTAHVVSSVGWLGAVAAFLALSAAGLTASSPLVVRAVYVAAQVITWAVIVPLSVASVVTGLAQSLGTPWGLLRHYWVIFKLLLTAAAALLLLLHTQPIGYVADAAASGTLAPGDLHAVRVQLLFDACAALAVLLTTTALSVFKPRGITPYGWRKQREQRVADVS